MCIRDSPGSRVGGRGDVGGRLRVAGEGHDPGTGDRQHHGGRQAVQKAPAARPLPVRDLAEQPVQQPGTGLGHGVHKARRGPPVQHQLPCGGAEFGHLGRAL